MNSRSNQNLIARSGTNVLRPSPLKWKIIIELRDIDPKSMSAVDDIYTLYSTDGSRRYEHSLTVKNDHFPGNRHVDLLFDKLLPGLSYTLEIDPGEDGEPYNVFENVSFDELKTLSWEE